MNKSYIFYCHDCKANFRKTVKLKTVQTNYGPREGIKCPLCGGRAEAKGYHLTVGMTNGEFPSVNGRDKILNLDL